MDFYIRFQVFLVNIQSYQRSWHQQTLHYEEILGSSYIKVTPTTFWLQCKNLPKYNKFCFIRKLKVAAETLVF